MVTSFPPVKESGLSLRRIETDLQTISTACKLYPFIAL